LGRANKDEINQEDELQQVVRNIQQGTLAGPWSFKVGLIFYKDRVYIRSQSPLTQAIIKVKI
jgi:hypothetical protein